MEERTPLASRESFDATLVTPSRTPSLISPKSVFDK